MSADPEGVAAQNSPLQRVHRSVLATLVLCAIVVWTAGDPDTSGEFDRSFTWVAFGLAAASILVRRAVAPGPLGPRHRRLMLASLLLAGSIAGVGVVLAVGGGPRGTSLLYVLGAAILALRPPPPIGVGA